MAGEMNPPLGQLRRRDRRQEFFDRPPELRSQDEGEPTQGVLIQFFASSW